MHSFMDFIESIECEINTSQPLQWPASIFKSYPAHFPVVCVGRLSGIEGGGVSNARRSAACNGADTI